MDFVQTRKFLSFKELITCSHFHCINIYDTNWMVKAHTNGGALGRMSDYCVFTIEPPLIVGFTTPKTSGVFIFTFSPSLQGPSLPLLLAPSYPTKTATQHEYVTYQ